jgi:hypothetical protein
VGGGKKCYICKRCGEVVTVSLSTLNRSVHQSAWKDNILTMTKDKGSTLQTHMGRTETQINDSGAIVERLELVRLP